VTKHVVRRKGETGGGPASYRSGGTLLGPVSAGEQLGGWLQRRRCRLVDEVDDIAESRPPVHEVRHARFDERPDVGRAGRRSGEPVGGRVEPGQHLDVGAVVERPSSAGEHFVNDDAERPDVGE